MSTTQSDAAKQVALSDFKGTTKEDVTQHDTPRTGALTGKEQTRSRSDSRDSADESSSASSEEAEKSEFPPKKTAIATIADTIGCEYSPDQSSLSRESVIDLYLWAIDERMLPTSMIHSSRKAILEAIAEELGTPFGDGDCDLTVYEWQALRDRVEEIAERDSCKRGRNKPFGGTPN